MHLLYVPLTRKEQNMGFCLLGLMLVSRFLLPACATALGEFLFYGIFFGATLTVFRRFLLSSAQIPLTPFFTVTKYALLGYALAFLANLLTNDLLFYFFSRYFYYNETGPHFLNLCKITLEAFASENLPLTALFMILFVPMVEELLYRGLVFGTLVQKSIPLAYLISTLLYCLALIIPILGNASPDYITLSFIQYIPVNLMLCWIYTRTETILTPILAHVVMNGLSILTLR